MLTIEPPFYVVDGLILLRDHEDPDCCYYLPPPPRLVVERTAEGLERPTFSLFKYRRDLTDNPALEPTRARGAGIATFEVEAALSPARLGRLRSEVAVVTGRPEARLVPALLRSGEVRAIVAQAEGERLIENLVETRVAPLLVPHRAAFALALSAEGATLVQQAAEGGSLPVGVVYELRFLALTPALHARVRMDYARVYDRFAASLGVQYYVRAELDVDLAWLIEHDAIQIEITAFTSDEDAERQRKLVMALIAARIQGDFFRRSMPPRPTGEGAAGPIGKLLASLTGGTEASASSAVFVLKAKLEMEDELRTFELVYDGRTALELTHVATGFLATMHDEGAPLDVREIDLDDPFFSSLRVEVQSAVDFDAMPDLLEAVVHLQKGEHRASHAFSRAAPQPFVFEVALTDPRDDEYEVRVEYVFDPTLGSGPTHIEAGPLRYRHRVFVLDPLAHFRYRRVRLILGPVDPAQVPAIRVQLRVPGEEGQPELAVATLTLDAAHGELVWRQRLPMAYATPRVLLRADWVDPGGQSHPGEELEVLGDSHVVLGPYRDLLKIQVTPVVDWQQVTQLVVELRYQDDDYVVTRALVLTAAQAGASPTVEIPLLHPERRKYAFRVVTFRVDGTTREEDWKPADQGLLLVGHEEPPRAVRVVLITASPGTLAVRVDLWVTAESGEDESTSVLLRPGVASEKVVALPLAPGAALAYRYEVRRYGESGEELVRVGEGTTGLLVVQA